jgi:soluble lytic murein transglycosylase-like protein
MLAVVAQSQAEYDRDASRAAATKRIDQAKQADAPQDKKTRTKTASAQSKERKPGKAKRGTQSLGIDRQQTSSIVRVQPELKATARKKVIGLGGETATTVASSTSYTTLVSQYAATYGVPVSLAHAVIRVESNYRPNMRGSAGEIGLMQIKPETARMMGYSGPANGLFNPETNIKYGMKYLGMAHQLAGGSTCGTILRYNAGHAARRMNPVSEAYCSKVQGLL